VVLLIFSVKLDISLRLIRHHAVKMFGDLAIHEHPLLSLAADQREWSDSRSAVLLQRETSAVPVEKEAELVPDSVLNRGSCRE
jgi:hypothetical protein